MRKALIIISLLIIVIIITYVFTKPLSTNNQNNCLISGCSKQLCAEEEMITTCDFRPEYACYRSAECTRQTDGGCGWTKTTQLDHCLNNARLSPEAITPF